MAKTTIGLTTGKELDVDGSIEDVRRSIDASGRRWVTLTVVGRRVDVMPAAIAYVIEEEAGPADESVRAGMEPPPTSSSA